MKTAIEHLQRNDKQLSKLIEHVGEISYHDVDDLFSFVVFEIIGQMISSKVRKVLIGRLLKLCPNGITTDSLLKLSQEDLRSIGLSNAKSSYILNFAEIVSQGNIDLNALKDLTDEEVTNELIKIKGIGNWTAKMFLLFALKRPNILPIEDGAFIQGFNWLYNRKETDKVFINRKAKKWQPYCSTAALYLYESVNRNFISVDVKHFFDELG